MGHTLGLGTLSTTVEILASVLGDPDVVASLVSEVLDVGLEVGGSNIVPMKRQEANEVSLVYTSLKYGDGNVLVLAIGLGVSGSHTTGLKVENPLETGRS